MNKKIPAEVTVLQAVAAEKWLTATLATVRAEVRTTPSAAAVERMHERVFGDRVRKPSRRRSRRFGDGTMNAYR